MWAEGGTEVFTYQITDGDGDPDTATLTITVPASPNEPPVVRGSSVNVSEEGLAGGHPDTAGTPDTTNSATASGSVFVSDPDGDALTVTLGIPSGTFTSGGTTFVWTLSNGGHTLTGTAGGDTVITITIDNAGGYNVTLSGPVDHPANAGEQGLGITVPVNVSDGEASTPTSISVTIEDDSPVVTPEVLANATVVLDETATTSTAPTINTGIYAKGNDPDVGTEPSLRPRAGDRDSNAHLRDGKLRRLP